MFSGKKNQNQPNNQPKPTFKKWTLAVHMAEAKCSLKTYKLLKQAQKFNSQLRLAICTPNEAGREQLKIDFNITIMLLSLWNLVLEPKLQFHHHKQHHTTGT